jgi:hypothetical protein
MSRIYYEGLDKQELLSNPSRYAWNCVLYYKQFTQDELLSLREWLTIRELIRWQNSVTREFLHTHFQKEIDDCLEVDWTDVEKYVDK